MQTASERTDEAGTVQLRTSTFIQVACNLLTFNSPHVYRFSRKLRKKGLTLSGDQAWSFISDTITEIKVTEFRSVTRIHVYP